MNSKLRVTILGAAVAVAAFGTGGSKCYPQSVGASANFDIDVNALTNTIQQAIVSAANREGAVKSMMEAAYNHTKQRYNVMVFNLNQNYDDSQLSGVKSYTNHTYSQIPYGVWVFESGTFVNQGDGGFINWAFAGSCKRTGKDDKTVVFSKINKPAPAPPSGSGSSTAMAKGPAAVFGKINKPAPAPPSGSGSSTAMAKGPAASTGAKKANAADSSHAAEQTKKAKSHAGGSKSTGQTRKAKSNSKPTTQASKKPTTKMKRVTIQAGDTLFSIAQKFLGAGNRFHEITHLDRTPFTAAHANNLQVGDVVLVPDAR